jgi:hypothetical protein
MTVSKENRTLSILNAAAAGKYGVLSAIAYALIFNYLRAVPLTTRSYNVEQLEALVRAAEAKRSPLIIQLFPSTLKQLPLLAHTAAHAVKAATVPLCLHIDHAQDVDHIREIIATLPVDSVMVDMSHYDEAENLEKTKILTKECHDRGVAVEAESGRIEGGEDGIADTGDLEGMHSCTGFLKNSSNSLQHSSHPPKTSTTSSPPASTSSHHQSATSTGTTAPPGLRKANCTTIASKRSTSKSTTAFSSLYTGRMTSHQRSCSGAFGLAPSS